MDSIGGYFELEIREGEEFYKHPIKLNTARNAFEYILRAKKYSKVYMPYFNCKVMYEPIEKLGLDFENYEIKKDFSPRFDYTQVKENEAFLYVNYFGVCKDVVKDIIEKDINVIIDNAQAFFNKPINGIDTIYSIRKFFGVPDGAYLFTESELNTNFERETVVNKVDHLIKRIEYGPTEGYDSFKKNDSKFIGGSTKKMSKLTEKLIKGIDYQEVLKKRHENFLFLHQRLKEKNIFNFNKEEIPGPLAYPFYVGESELKEYLISKKIYIPTYWPNLIDGKNKNYLGYKLAKYLVPIPIDQRYGKKEMHHIVKHINSYL